MVNSISKTKCNRRRINRLIAIMMSFMLVISLVMIPANKAEAAGSKLTSIYLTYDKDVVDLNTAWMEYEVSSRLINNCDVDRDMTAYGFLPGYSYLACKESDGSFTDLSQSYEYVDRSKNYYYALCVNLYGKSLANIDMSEYKWQPKKISSTFDLMINKDNNGNYSSGSYYPVSSDSYLLVSDDGTMATFFIPADAVSTDQRATHVYFTPRENISINKGEYKDFYATLEGTVAYKVVNWKVSGTSNPNTKVIQTGQQQARLSIANDETASSIKLKAYSGYDHSVSYEIDVRIGASSEIKTVNLNFDDEVIALRPGYTEGEVSERAYTACSVSGAGAINLCSGTSDVGLFFDYGGLPKGEMNDIMYGIGDGTTPVDVNTDYYLCFRIYHDLGYKWPQSIIDNDRNLKSIKNFPELTINVNGVQENRAYIDYNSSLESVRVFVPIDIFKENIEKHSDKLSIAGITDKTYTGSAITQTLTVTFGGKTLVEGTDYTVSYSNNVNVGTANVTVTGIGTYKGSVSKTFKINAPASQGGSTGSTTTTPKYSNEWVNGKWYNADGTQTYEGTLEWKCNSTGWWVEDSSGWYPVSQWQKIDGKWYYFLDSGYMDYSEYRDGYWLGSDGAMVDGYYGEWKSDSKGWWFEDTSGWYPQSQWLWIDGTCYYFGADGYWDGTTA